MERILLDVSFWEINFIDITKLTPENYIHFWRLINTEQYHFGEEHINIASALANIFVGQELFPLFGEFLLEINSEKLMLLKNDEQFLRALIKLYMHENRFSEVYSLIEDKIFACFLQEGKFTTPEDLIEVWDDAHYREKALGLGQPLTPLEKFRIRKRYPPPPSICSKGRPVKSIPESSKEVLMKWYKKHLDDPYPSKLKKQKLAAESGLTLTQVKTWFSNARRTGRRKQQAKKMVNKPKPKPTRKSKYVPKKTKEWKLNKTSATQNLASLSSCPSTQIAEIQDGNSGKNVGLEDKDVHQEILDYSKINKGDTETKTKVGSSDLSAKEKKNLSEGEANDRRGDKIDLPATAKAFNVPKAAEKINFKKHKINSKEPESDDSKKTRLSNNQHKPLIESDQDEVTSTTGNKCETLIYNHNQTPEGSINRNIQMLLKNKLEKKYETYNTDLNNNRYFMDFGCEGYSPDDTSSNSLAALSELCERIKPDSLSFNQNQGESVNVYDEDKPKCRKLNRLEKLQKDWKESLMNQYPYSMSVPEPTKTSSHQSACSVKHCNQKFWDLGSPTRSGEGISDNHRSLLQYYSPVYTHQPIQQPNGYHGYQMMSPRIADEAEQHPLNTFRVPDSLRWTNSEAASSFSPRTENRSPIFADAVPALQHDHHGYRGEGHCYSNRSQVAWEYPSLCSPFGSAVPPGGETFYMYEETPLNFSSSATQSRNSLDDAVEGLLNLSSSQEMV